MEGVRVWMRMDEWLSALVGWSGGWETGGGGRVESQGGGLIRLSRQWFLYSTMERGENGGAWRKLRRRAEEQIKVCLNHFCVEMQCV